MRQRVFKNETPDRPADAPSAGADRSTARLCDQCGAPFDPPRPWSRYCSERCRREHGRHVHALASELSKRRPGERVTIQLSRGGAQVITEQQTLDLPPASRRRDPATSKAAETDAPIQRQAQQLHEALKRYGPGTMHEIAQRSGLDYFVCQRRISVLDRNRLARRDGTAVNPVTGKRCTVWRAV